MSAVRALQSAASALWARDPVRYVVVAGTTTLGYLGLMALGVRLGWHYMVAILVAQAITIACAYPAYRRWVFRSTEPMRATFPKFLTVWSSGAVAGIVATPLLVEVFGLPPVPAQVIAVVVVAVASYLGHRLFSFRGRSHAHEPAGEDGEY